MPGYPPGPPPAHRVELWVGAYRPRGLDLIARLGDGWVPSVGYMSPGELRAAAGRLDEMATRAGRDPRTIRHIFNVSGRITDGALGDGPLVGPVDLWIETLAGWAETPGADAFVFWASDTGTTEIARFAGEIAPAVRKALAG